MEKITKTAMITVCGRPNVGKSSLTNALVGEKIAIVSDKPQTTRNRIYGVVNRDGTQYVLLDTPGLHKPRSRLGDYMVKVVRESLSDVECALLLVEPIFLAYNLLYLVNFLFLHKCTEYMALFLLES